MLSLDIQAEIMKKLPVKSLIQFRSVCKAWKSLIDSSKFIVGYNVHHDHLMIRYRVRVRYREELKVKYVCFVDDDSFPQQKFDLIVPHLVQVTRTIGSCQGLLCLTGYSESSKMQMVVLWNPAIRKSIGVVVPNWVLPPFNHVVGFGVCPDTKDPKLVKITYICDNRKIKNINFIPSQVMVFTMSSREWTCLRSSNLPRKSIGFTWSQKVIGQFIYWLAYDSINGENGKSRSMIMSFDLSTEEFREVDLPVSLNYKVRKSELSVYRLRESVAVVEDLTWKRVYSVWMMENDDSKAFTKLFTINLPNASASQILGFRKSGEPIVAIQDDHRQYDSQIVVYEPFSEHIKYLGIRGKRFSLCGNFYTESLLLLDHDDGHIVRCGAVSP